MADHDTPPPHAQAAAAPIQPLEYLRQLQDEARREGGRGFHKELRAWVDDNSEVARVLTALDNQQSTAATS